MLNELHIITKVLKVIIPSDIYLGEAKIIYLIHDKFNSIVLIIRNTTIGRHKRALIYEN